MEEETPSGCLPSSTPFFFYSLATGTEEERRKNDDSPTIITCPISVSVTATPLPILAFASCVCVFTLSRHDEAGHAVRDAGAGCQEGDAHDDIRDTERETDHRHLRQRQIH